MITQQLVLKSKDLFYLGESVSDGVRDRAAGLYARDTRFLNQIRLSLEGVHPETLSTTVHHASAATITSANDAMALRNGVLLHPHLVAIEQRVTVDTALHIAFVLQNFSQEVISLDLQLLFDADFHDVFEIRGFQRESAGIVLAPRLKEGAIHFRYRANDNLELGTVVSFDRHPQTQLRHRTESSAEALVSLLPGSDEVHWEPAPDHLAGVLASFPLELQPSERWELRVAARPFVSDKDLFSTMPVVLGHAQSDRATIVTDNPFFNRLLARSQDDLDALMTSFPDGDLPAAGIPWYVAPFGRDSLITGLQTFHISPADAHGTLRVLAALQGKKIDHFTEEQPGKILHEMRYGEMARTREIPHRPYYGTVDATPLFVLLFAETVAWSADDTLYFDLLPEVRAALQWIEDFGDLDGDGFIEYDSNQTSSVRIRHQVWKDSHDSLHHADGNPAVGLISPVEVQGYTYAAYRRLADVASAFADPDFAAELNQKAQELKTRFAQAFWVEEEAFYAQALDGCKTQVSAITSNPGHLLFTGILPIERARSVVQRLRQPDMESGWGIRTLSSAAPSYNPMSYHNGSVWPHDNSLFAAGCFDIGEADTANEIFEALVDAGRLSAGERLNELYCGFSRSGSATDAPVPYPSACSPQAWAAGCYPHLVRSALGLRADIASGVIRISPQLPPFLSEITIRNLRVLGHVGNLSVRRTADGYAVSSEGLPI